MDKDALALRFMEGLVFVLKIKRAEDHLVQLLLARGIEEDQMQAYLANRGQALRLKVLKVAVALVVAGFLLSKLLDTSSLGQIGIWIMYAGMVLGALQFKGVSDSTPNARSIKSMLKK